VAAMGVQNLLSYLKKKIDHKRINLIEEAKNKNLTVVVDGNAFVILLKDRYKVSKRVKEIYLCFFGE
jgi:hypothetical protein